MRSENHIQFNEADTTIINRFKRMVQMYPERDAIKFESKTLTYAELDAQSDVLAKKILGLVEQDQGQIAMFLNTGLDQIISILGIMKAGKAYVPIDISFPTQRITKILADSRSELLISNNFNLAQAKELSGKTNVPLFIIEDIHNYESASSTNYPGPEDFTHVIYTSGSTAKPKGVFHNHYNIVQFISHFSELVNINPGDRFAFYYSISFSAHTMPIFGILLNGGCLCLFDLKNEGFIDLKKWLEKEDVSLILMIPSVLRHFMSTLNKKSKFPRLRTMLIGGETLYRSDVVKMWPYLRKDASMINIYASTEAYLVSAFPMNRDDVLKDNIVPIGYPVKGVSMEIRDSENKILEPTHTGEIVIQSPSLAQGYWNDTAKTEKDFFINENGKVSFRTGDMGYFMEDYCVVHVGRKDSVIKLRGFRIDLGEIENALLSYKTMKEVAAVIKENDQGEKQIVAYVVSKDNNELDEEYVKLAVLRNLPDYMVPSHVVKLEELPKNTNGKIDYKELPEPDWKKEKGERSIVGARTNTEAALVEIFEKSVQIKPIGISENVFELGVDSLKLFVAFDEIEKKFNKQLDIDAIVSSPTIEQMAKLLEDL